ncbi:caveolae-associated protein 1 [Esox lucius]|uniref:Caveolae associated protein 1a n=1 Tax=Esox lucius TaxID=8010 RepID=A0AAY5K759_ESOLU|nr:caveolae-associated protein 1 [Esox lucius]
MADPVGLQKERVPQTEVSDDDETSLVAAAVQPATTDSDDDISEEVDLALAAGSGTKSEAQINGVMVLTLLDKIIGVVDQIQQTQNGLEARQQDMENSVSSIQGELAKLSKSHTGTANSVNKMLDKVRKVSVNVKTVRTNLEKQAGQIKKLESNENELLKRRNFKVLIYQDQNKAAKATLKTSEGAETVAEGGSVEGGLERIPEEGGEVAHTGINSEEEVEIEEIIEESRAEKIKRTGKARVENIKKAFSKEQREKRAQKTKENLEKTKQKTKENLEKTRQKTKENLEKTRQRTHDKLEKTKHSLEKKMGKLGNKMTPNMERKEKIKGSKEKLQKSLTPDHTVYARSKTAVYRVPPFTFHVKKIRDGVAEVVRPEGMEMVEVAEKETLQAGDGDGEVAVGELVRVGFAPEKAAVLELDDEEEEEDEEEELVRVDTPEMAALLEVAEDQVAEHLVRLESKMKTTMKTASD